MDIRQAQPTRLRTFTALIVDHEPRARACMVTLLRTLGATDIAEATSLVQARAAAGEFGPRDVGLVDLGVPGGGLDLLADLRNAGWRRLLVVSAMTDAFSIRAAYVAGAHGYLLRAGADGALSDDVRRAISYEATLAITSDASRPLPAHTYPRPAVPRIPSPRTSSAPVSGPAQPVPHRVTERGWRQLSGREIEVLRLVAAGRSNSSAGEHLQLSALTVKSHLARIARKLGTGDRAHMVAVAMRAGLIG